MAWECAFLVLAESLTEAAVQLKMSSSLLLLREEVVCCLVQNFSKNPNHGLLTAAASSSHFLSISQGLVTALSVLVLALG